MPALLARHAEAQIREAMKDTRVVAIAGPRQSGKTTLARAIASETHAYLTLDDPATLASAHADPAGMIRRLDSAVIDEIQRAPELVLAIKRAVDENPRPGRFLITGSADILAMPKASESLAGRIEIVPLLPLSQAEIRGAPASGFLDAAFAGAFADKAVQTDDLAALVMTGGYPEAVARTGESRRRAWHRAYLRSLLDRDLRDLSHASRLDRMPDLFNLLATRAGQLVNWSSLGNDARLDGKTVEHYLRLLEQLYLVRRLPAWSGNQTQRLVSTPKLHFIDSGLLASTLGLNAAQVMLDRSPLGPALETFVHGELLKASHLSADPVNLSHYRDKDMLEVDFVLERSGDIVGVEVKAAASVTAADFRGLKRLRDRVGAQFRSGIVLFDGEQVLPFGDRLFAAPIAHLWTP
jgi:uncharacterized protein